MCGAKKRRENLILIISTWEACIKITLDSKARSTEEQASAMVLVVRLIENEFILFINVMFSTRTTIGLFIRSFRETRLADLASFRAAKYSSNMVFSTRSVQTNKNKDLDEDGDKR